MRARTDVVVAGGGFGGLYAASYLAEAQVPNREIRVTLVSERNYFTFTPLLVETLGGGLGRQHVTVPCRVLAERRGFRFRLGRIDAVDPGQGLLHTADAPIPFDYAILAFGAGPRYFGNDELERHALPLASVRDAMLIHDRVLRLAERVEDETSPGARRRALTFVVAGAGPAGVEAASEIHNLLRRVLPRYYDLRGEGRVLLVEGGDRILSGWDADLAAEGLAALRERGIDVWLNSRVTGADSRTVRVRRRTGSGEEDHTLQAETLVWTAGMSPASAPAAAGGLRLAPSGHVAVEHTLRAVGHERLFALGDLVRLENPRTGSPYPAAAPIAISQAVRAAANVENAIAGRALEPYEAHHAGKIVSLGDGVALVDVLGFRVRGRAAWAIYRTAYLMKLVGLKNKIRAVVTLALNRVFEPDLGTLE